MSSSSSSSNGEFEFVYILMLSKGDEPWWAESVHQSWQSAREEGDLFMNEYHYTVREFRVRQDPSRHTF